MFRGDIIFIGSHTDDIEHGAGGTLHRIVTQENCRVTYFSCSRCTDLERNRDITLDQTKVIALLERMNCKVIMKDYKNRFLYRDAHLIRKDLETIRERSIDPIVFTHSLADIHQDHQIVAAEANRVFRDATIIEFEVLRSCPTFVANMFVPLDTRDLAFKIELLSQYHTQQLYYNNEKTIRSLAEVRGVMINQALAEAFYIRRLIVRS